MSLHRKGDNFKINLMGKNLIVILGATASGKTHLAARLASELQGEIISADSRQVYRGMDLGTGKDLHQYIIDGRRVPCHLVDILDPSCEFNVYDFQKRFYEVFDQVRKRNRLPVLCGGTGLYLEAVLMSYQMPQAVSDPALTALLSEKTIPELQEILCSYPTQLHNRTDLDDRGRLIRRIEIEAARKNPARPDAQRPVIDPAVFGIRRDRTDLRRRIALRLKERIGQGMIEEVEGLHTNGLSWERLESFGLEYRFIAQYLQDKITKDEMISLLAIAIGQFAKRQETWFRRMERRGIDVTWVDGDDYQALKDRIMKAMDEETFFTG